MYMYLIVHDIGIGLGCGLILKWGARIEQLICNDPQGPPVTANTIVCRPVQARQDLWGDVLWSANWETRLQLGKRHNVCIHYRHVDNVLHMYVRCTKLSYMCVTLRACYGSGGRGGRGGYAMRDWGGRAERKERRERERERERESKNE